jgi:hypothetical protein
VAPFAGYGSAVGGDSRRDSQPARRAPTRGRPDYHDPTAGLGGAPPAYSALTLRLVLAAFGFLSCAGFAVWSAVADFPMPLVVAPALLAVVAAVDLVVIVRRKRRGEPG